MPPEELDTQMCVKQCGIGFLKFTSLLRCGGGWFANHPLNLGRQAVFHPRHHED